MQHKILVCIIPNLAKLCLCYMLCCNVYAYIDQGKYQDYRNMSKDPDIQKMQDFHLEQAKSKIQDKKNIHAWGDLAYILCQIPNHPIAIQKMLMLTAELQKEQEMQLYFSKAINLYPDDEVLHMLYGVFLFNQGSLEEAAKELELAKASGDLKLSQEIKQ